MVVVSEGDMGRTTSIGRSQGSVLDGVDIA